MKVSSQRTIELIRKLIQTGYVDIHNLNDRSRYPTEGVPHRGSIISPLFANIYLHELDKELKTMKEKFDKGERRPANKEYIVGAVTEPNTNPFKNLPPIMQEALKECPQFKNAVKAEMRKEAILKNTPSVVLETEDFKRMF